MTEASTVPCPTCGATAGAGCVGVGGFHGSRIKAAPVHHGGSIVLGLPDGSYRTRPAVTEDEIRLDERRKVCAEERHREVEITTLGQQGKTFRCARCGETREQAPPPPCPECEAAVHAWDPHRDVVEDYHDGPFDRYRPGPLEILLAPCGHTLRLQVAVDYARELKHTTGQVL